jgi:hypothetical protein
MDELHYIAKYPKALKKVVGEDLTTTWTLSLSDTLGKRPIDLAKNEMGFNFIKALLAEYISVSIIPKANILRPVDTGAPLNLLRDS